MIGHKSSSLSHLASSLLSKNDRFPKWRHLWSSGNVVATTPVICEMTTCGQQQVRAGDSHPPLLCSQQQQNKEEVINNSVKSIFGFPELKATDSVLLMV